MKNKVIYIVLGVLLTDSICKKFKNHFATIEDVKLESFIQGYELRIFKWQGNPKN